MEKLTNKELNHKFESEYDFSEKEIDLLFDKNYTCDYCDNSIFKKYSGTIDFPEIDVKNQDIKCFECDTNSDCDICPLCEDKIYYSLEQINDDKKHYENDKFIPYFYLELIEETVSFLEGVYNVVEIHNSGVFDQKKLNIGHIEFAKLTNKNGFDIGNGSEICKECESKYKLNEIEVQNEKV